MNRVTKRTWLMGLFLAILLAAMTLWMQDGQLLGSTAQ